MRSAFMQMVESGHLSVIEALSIPGRKERNLPIPDAYKTPSTKAMLELLTGNNGNLWSHQAKSLEAISNGSNIVVSTSTASGKSLIFQIALLNELLSSNITAILVYPLKALLSDQLSRWKQIVQALNLPDNYVAEIHGQIDVDSRQVALRDARILLVTPDILQAWLMRQVTTPSVRSFLSRLRFLVVDEAHVYESVFGSNTAYLIRRLLAARRKIGKEMRVDVPLQIIAATATISDPVEHLTKLTGWDFVSVGEEEDGSPRPERTLVHVEGPDRGGGAEAMLRDIISTMLVTSETGAFIAFHNSRQGVERIAKSLNDDDVLPYRGGYEVRDRQNIERALRAGTLKGVVATSALELGIDISHFDIGFNIGAPESKKSFRQRLGRVGRSRESTFVVVAPRHAFTRFGNSFDEYFKSSVEPSHLYLDNRFIQFAQARCLIDESDALGLDTADPPPGVQWPSSFKSVYEFARPGRRRPKEFDFIAQLGADSPHTNYPLRQVGEASYRLREGGRDFHDEIGDIALNQAIREAYPGALYLHLKKPLKVVDWRSTSFDRSIRLEGARSQAPTRPMLKKTVGYGLGSDDIVQGRILSSPVGVLAEVNLQVNESVEGFTIGNTSFRYKDLRATDPRMTRKQRDFRTTGVVFRIEETWFSGGGPTESATRRTLAEALGLLLKRERSIATNDVDVASTNIAFYYDGAPRRTTDTIVVYDSVYGGLRLTESLFSDCAAFLVKLNEGASVAGDDALVTLNVAERFNAWFSRLSPGGVAPGRDLMPADGEYIVYLPDSVVAVLHQGVLVDRRLISPQLMNFGGSQILVYSYDTGGRGAGLIPHDQVQAVGNDWALGYWNPATNSFRSADEESSF